MKKVLLACLALSLVACSNDDDDTAPAPAAAAEEKAEPSEVDLTSSVWCSEEVRNMINVISFNEDGSLISHTYVKQGDDSFALEDNFSAHYSNAEGRLSIFTTPESAEGDMSP